MRHDPLCWLALCLIGTAGALLGIAAATSVHAQRRSSGAELPEIRTTAANTVPACVTPARLDAVLAERNTALDPRFVGIAGAYKKHGEALKIRWDYAFYQMLLETNSLKYTGDVKPRQNNFAGLGATGGGVRGESFASVDKGVLAHLQHLVAYSGEEVADPVAERTRDNQDGIISKSKALGRPVRFSDLVNRWAMDRGYATKIESIATTIRDQICAPGADEPVAVAPKPKTADSAAVEEEPAAPTRRSRRGASTRGPETASGEPPMKPSGLGMPPAPSGGTAQACSVLAASFGGDGTTLLIRTEASDAVVFTALGVEGGAEQAMADAYIKQHAPGGKVAGRFKTSDDAVAHAYGLCDSGKP
jgi:hypothetical protein